MLMLEVESRPDGTAAIAAVGEIDAATAARLSAAVHRQLDSGSSMLELDLHEVTFLGVTGLQVLLCAADRAMAGGVVLRMVYRDPSPAQRALEAAGMVSSRRPDGVRGDVEVERSVELRTAGVDRERWHARVDTTAGTAHERKVSTSDLWLESGPASPSLRESAAPADASRGESQSRHR